MGFISSIAESLGYNQKVNFDSSFFDMIQPYRDAVKAHDEAVQLCYDRYNNACVSENKLWYKSDRQSMSIYHGCIADKCSSEKSKIDSLEKDSNDKGKALVDDSNYRVFLFLRGVDHCFNGYSTLMGSPKWADGDMTIEEIRSLDKNGDSKLSQSEIDNYWGQLIRSAKSAYGDYNPERNDARKPFTVEASGGASLPLPIPDKAPTVQEVRDYFKATDDSSVNFFDLAFPSQDD